MPQPAADQPFLTDVETLRQRARSQMESGVVTESYRGDVGRTIEVLQSVLAKGRGCGLGGAGGAGVSRNALPPRCKTQSGSLPLRLRLFWARPTRSCSGLPT